MRLAWQRGCASSFRLRGAVWVLRDKPPNVALDWSPLESPVHVTFGIARWSSAAHRLLISAAIALSCVMFTWRCFHNLYRSDDRPVGETAEVCASCLDTLPYGPAPRAQHSQSPNQKALEELPTKPLSTSPSHKEHPYGNVPPQALLHGRWHSQCSWTNVCMSLSCRCCYQRTPVVERGAKCRVFCMSYATSRSADSQWQPYAAWLSDCFYWRFYEL